MVSYMATCQGSFPETMVTKKTEQFILEHITVMLDVVKLRVTNEIYYNRDNGR